jgi:hypothetical protein
MRKFAYRDLQKCAEREAALRRNVYAKRGMTNERVREIAMMAEIAELLKGLSDATIGLEDDKRH